MSGERIDLGLSPSVRLGRLTLEPAVRAIRRDDGAEDVVEPRVMQVLLALAEQPGRIVRREELTERCWEGRIVGEDAINRVLSRLRRVTEGIGADSFRIETITKVGYRLIVIGESATGPPPPATVLARPTRRSLMLVGGLGAIGAAGSCLALWRSHRRELPHAAREAMDRGIDAMRVGSPDQVAVAVAAFREASAAAPDHAEPYAWLALAYSLLNTGARGQEAVLNAARTREAAAKALRIDPDSGDAQAALIAIKPLYRNWLAYEAACLPVLQRHPDNPNINSVYMGLLAGTGRVAGVNDIARRMIARDAAWPSLHTSMVLSSWCLNRLDDADAAMDRAIELWPRSIGVWFVRQRFLAYTSRAAQALAMVDDIDHRPLGLPAWDFDLCRAESQALLTRSKADIDAAANLYWPLAHKSVGEACNALQFFTAVGRLDEAIAIANALYFNRGFDVGERNFTEEQGTYLKHLNRPTWLFWFPYMAPLRADPRLGAIFEEIGLNAYWRKSGHKPDVPVIGIT